MNGPATKPDWDLLFETASAQEARFTTRQAAKAGYSSRLPREHIRAGRVERARRGIRRLVHRPAGEHEELVTAWMSRSAIRSSANPRSCFLAPSDAGLLS